MVKHGRKKNKRENGEFIFVIMFLPKLNQQKNNLLSNLITALTHRTLAEEIYAWRGILSVLYISKSKGSHFKKIYSKEFLGEKKIHGLRILWNSSSIPRTSSEFLETFSRIPRTSSIFLQLPRLLSQDFL